MPKPSEPPVPPQPDPTPTNPPAPEPTTPPAPPEPVLNAVPYRNLTFAAPEPDPNGFWTRRIRVNDYYIPGCNGADKVRYYSQSTSQGGSAVISVHPHFYDVTFASDFANPLQGFTATIWVCDL